MHFGENQLSRSLIGLSPLTTGHPPGFQPWWVRASTPSYRRFTLPMARSLRFGSRTRDSNALIGLAFATATPPGLTSRHATNSQAHSSKGTPSPPPARRLRLSSDGLKAHGFRNSFTPLPGYFSPFPHGTRALSVTRKYSALPGGPGRFTRDFTGPALLGNSTTSLQHVVYGTLTHSGRPLACRSTTPQVSHSSTGRQTHEARPTTPTTQPLPGITRHRFRLNPLSLATTHGITCCFLFLRVMRCFTSPRSLHTPYEFRCR